MPSQVQDWDAILKSYDAAGRVVRGLVSTQRASDIYAKVAARIQPFAECVDATDLNYDVCVTISVNHHHSSVDVLISMIADYATLIDTCSNDESVTMIVSPEDSRWKDIISTLADLGIVVLGASELMSPIPLKLALCADGGCILFNALFRDQAVNRLDCLN